MSLKLSAWRMADRQHHIPVGGNALEYLDLQQSTQATRDQPDYTASRGHNYRSNIIILLRVLRKGDGWAAGRIAFVLDNHSIAR